MDREKLSILLDRERFVQAISGQTVKDAAELLSVSTATICEKAKLYECRSIFSNPTPCVSSYEKKIIDLLDQHDISYQLHDRTIIHPNELDIYIPKFRLAIEVGSAYFHSESNGRVRQYHHTKWKRCEEQGICLLQFFDDDIKTNWHLTESKIKRLLNI
jgi:hypothetical protein